MEEDKIKDWASRFGEKNPKLIFRGNKLLTKEVSKDSAEIKLEIASPFGKKEIITFSWLHSLYKEAKEKLEDDTWSVEYAYKQNDDYYLYLSNKHKNYLYKGSFGLNEMGYTDEGKDIYFVVAELAQVHDDNSLISLNKEEYSMLIDKKKAIELSDFLKKWMEQKSDKRLKLLLKESKIITFV